MPTQTSSPGETRAAQPVAQARQAGDAKATVAAIVAGDVYFTSYGRPHRKGRRLVCGADEDAVTLAVEAGEAAMTAWDGDPATVDGLFVAAATGPEVDGGVAQVVREALGLSTRTAVTTFAPEGLSAVSALQAAVQAVESGALEHALVIASEAAPRSSERCSAGAAALVVSAMSDSARCVSVEEVARVSSLTHATRRSTPAEPFEPDRRFLEHRYARLAAPALDELRKSAARPFDALVFTGGVSSYDSRLREAYYGNVRPSAARRDVDDFGVASPLVAVLDAVQAMPSQTVGLVAHGDGQLVVLRLQLPAEPGDAFGWNEPLAEPPPPESVAEVGPALSLPVDSPFFARTWGETLRLDAARCGSCERVVYPASTRPICPGCGGRTWEAYRLQRTGTVLTHIDNRFLPDGFPAKAVSLLAELSDGYRHWAPTPPEVKGGDVAIGDAVRLRLRRFTVRDGVAVYGMKFVPESGS